MLPIAWRHLFRHSSPCGADVDCRAMTLPSVVHFQFFELFSVLRSTAYKLVSLWNCFSAHELLLGNRIILPRSNSMSCWNFFFFRRGGILRSRYNPLFICFQHQLRGRMLCDSETLLFCVRSYN